MKFVRSKYTLSDYNIVAGKLYAVTKETSEVYEIVNEAGHVVTIRKGDDLVNEE